MQDFNAKTKKVPNKLGQLVTLAPGHQSLPHTPWVNTDYSTLSPLYSCFGAIPASGEFFACSSTTHLRKHVYLLCYILYF